MLFFIEKHIDLISAIIVWFIIISFLIAVVIIPIYNRVHFRIKYGDWPRPSYRTAIRWKYLEGLPPEERILTERWFELQMMLSNKRSCSEEQLKKIRDEIQQIASQLYK